MWKITRKVTKETSGEQEMGSVYDSYLDETRKVVFSLVFSLAKLTKVTPKRLATEFSKNNSVDYAKKFNAELARIEEKNIKALEARLNKPKKTQS